MKLSRKSFLVTGGAGFLGRNLVRQLVQENAHTIVLDNLSYAPKSNVPNDVTLIVADASDLPRKKHKALRDIDYIIHLGSPSSVILFERDPQDCFSATLNSLIGVFEFAKSEGVRRVIYPSSGSVYGTKPPPQSEKDIPKPCNLYAVAKLACENVAGICAPTVPSTGLRIFAGFGPGEEHKGAYASPVTIFLRSMMEGRRPLVYGDGTQTRDFIWVEDVVRAMLAAIEMGHDGIVNVGSGVSTSFNEVIQRLNTALKTSVKAQYVRRPASYLEHTQADTSLMEATLGLKPTPVGAAIDKYVDRVGRGKTDSHSTS